MLELHVVDVPYTSRTDIFNLWGIFDVHLGARACDEKKLRETIARIDADPFALWFEGGDKCEYINITDRRFNPQELAPWIDLNDLDDLAMAQSRKYIELFKPIAGKCVGSVGGNHEWTIWKKFKFDPHGHICGELKIPNLGYEGGFVILSFIRRGGTRHTLKCLLQHGWGGGRKPGGKVNKLDDALNMYNADVLFLGHTHDRHRQAKVFWDCGRRKVFTRQRIAVRCGTYLDGASYAIRGQYPPAETGSVCVHFKPDSLEKWVTL